MHRDKRGLGLLVVPDNDFSALFAGLLLEVGLDVVHARTGEQALKMADRAAPSLAIIALDVSGPTGYEVLFRLRSRHGRLLAIGVVAAALDAMPRDEVAALLLGADDYFERALDPDVAVARVRRLIARNRSSGMRSQPSEGRAGTGVDTSLQASRLTRREHQVLTLLVDGRRTIEIADLLCITPKTVSTHVERILGKLGAHSQAQAVAFALQQGVVEIDAGVASPA